MKRNSIKMVHNPHTNKIAYFFKNEIGEWINLSGSSPLSRQYYTNTSVEERGSEIIRKLDEIYNRRNKGLDILFEGTDTDYNLLKNQLEKDYLDKAISCRVNTTKIAVLGKTKVGKTTLIEELGNLNTKKFSKTVKEDFIQYDDENNHIQWIELNGIDLGLENVNKAYQTITNLSEELSAVVYCILGTTGRIEDIEKELIQKIDSQFAGIKVMVVLTNCSRSDEEMQEVMDEIEKVTEHAKIVKTLAKEMKLRNNEIIEPFGLEHVSEYIFEGR